MRLVIAPSAVLCRCLRIPRGRAPIPRRWWRIFQRDAASPGTGPPSHCCACGPEGAFRRLFTALGDLVGIVLIVYAFPVVILAIGIPIALLVRLAAWMVGAL